MCSFSNCKISNLEICKHFGAALECFDTEIDGMTQLG